MTDANVSRLGLGNCVVVLANSSVFVLRTVAERKAGGLISGRLLALPEGGQLFAVAACPNRFQLRSGHFHKVPLK